MVRRVATITFRHTLDEDRCTEGPIRHHRAIRHAGRARLALLLAIAAAACGPRPEPQAEPVPQSVLAPGLDIDLSAMERTRTGLYLQTLREGSGDVAVSGSEVRVHYDAWFADGTRFDSSRQRGQPIEIPIGQDIVIDAWDEGIVGMRVGEVRRLVVPPALGYGDEGVPGAIPPGATLIFEVELLGVR